MYAAAVLIAIAVCVALVLIVYLRRPLRPRRREWNVDLKIQTTRGDEEHEDKGSANGDSSI